MVDSLKGLPKEALEEVLEFIRFIRQKQEKKILSGYLNENDSLSISQTNHLEEEFKDYKTKYPNE